MTSRQIFIAALLIGNSGVDAFASSQLTSSYSSHQCLERRRLSIPCRLELSTSSTSAAVVAAANTVLQTLETLQSTANEYADSFDLGPAEAAFYALFLSLRQSKVPLGLHGQPFVLRNAQVEQSLRQPTQWPGFFTMKDLEKAVSDDFLDAARGSTDNRKGWRVRCQFDFLCRLSDTYVS
jgi:hypothetical protein